MTLGIDVPAQRGRADSGDLEVDLTELFAEAASVGEGRSFGAKPKISMESLILAQDERWRRA